MNYSERQYLRQTISFEISTIEIIVFDHRKMNEVIVLL